MHPGEQLLVEAVDVADGLLQDLGLKQSSQWRLDRLNPFGGGGRVTVQIVPPKNLSTILLGHKLNVCFSTATTAGAGQFREETLYLEKKKRTHY